MQENHMSRDPILIEIMQLKEAMSGISAKTQTYNDLKGRYDELVGRTSKPNDEKR